MSPSKEYLVLVAIHPCSCPSALPYGSHLSTGLPHLFGTFSMKSFDVSVRGVYSPCLILSTSGAYLSLILSVALPDDGVVFCFLVSLIFFFFNRKPLIMQKRLMLMRFYTRISTRLIFHQAIGVASWVALDWR